MAKQLYKVSFSRVIKAEGAAEALKIFLEGCKNPMARRESIRVFDFNPNYKRDKKYKKRGKTNGEKNKRRQLPTQRGLVQSSLSQKKHEG